jgi:hypothetical protein
VSTEVIIGLLSAAVSVLGAVTAGLMTTWSGQRTRRYEQLLTARQKAQEKAEQAEVVLSRYREPLLLAAQNLHSRLFRIVQYNVLNYLHSGDPDLDCHTRNYTVYVLAEYLCWAEIIRRDLRFLDLGAEERNRELVCRLEHIQRAIVDQAVPRPLRLFRGQQRAIGEVMMIPTHDLECAQYEALGYAQFCARLNDDPVFAHWFQRLRFGLDQVAEPDQTGHTGLTRLQHCLVDLIEFLDPNRERCPARPRDRLELLDTIGPATASD